MARRNPRWQDLVGTLAAGLWPLVVTLAVLHDPSRYDPLGVYSGLGIVPFHKLATLPTTDPNVFATAYSLGLHAASSIAHGHLAWWNPNEGLGAPLIGELQSGGLFPFSLLLLFHNGPFIFHVSLEMVAGVSTYWLLRELRCGPIVATAGGMLFATNGTFALLSNAAFNPVCFIPLLVLGFERARRAALEGRGGGWRWLAVGGALLLLAGFVETATLALILAVVLAVQRGFTLPRDKVVPYVRKSMAGLAVGVAIAAPVLVAFRDFLVNGFVAEHAGDAASRSLSGPYVAMSLTPYLFGRIFESSNAAIHSIWGAVGGYAGFALLALAVAGLLGRRDRGLRIALGCWVGAALADTMGVTPFKQVFSSFPLLDHIVLYRYLPPTWEFALVVLAALALRDLATSSRAESLIAVTTGTLVASLVLLIGLHDASKAVTFSRSLTPSAFHASELLVVAAVAGMLLAALLPSRFRAAAVGLVVVVEAAVLFAIPLVSWPQSDPIDTGVTTFLAHHVGSERFAGLGVPTPNLGTAIGAAELDVVDLPVPKSFVAFASELDPYENATVFTGSHHPVTGQPSATALMARNFLLYEQLGVKYVVTRSNEAPFLGRSSVTLAYHDPRFKIWELPHPEPFARVPGCAMTTAKGGDYLVSCSHPSVLLVNQLYFPGWSASVNGVAATVQDRGRLQAVKVPTGRSVVALSFLPPDVPVAAVAALVAFLSLFVPWGVLAARRRRRRDETASVAGLGTATHAGEGGHWPTDPPTGAFEFPGLGVEEPGEPTSSTAAVGADDQGPPTPSIATIATRGAEDPPTLSGLPATPPDGG